MTSGDELDETPYVDGRKRYPGIAFLRPQPVAVSVEFVPAEPDQAEELAAIQASVVREVLTWSLAHHTESDQTTR